MAPVQFTDAAPFVLHLGPSWKRMSPDEFFDFCQRNPDLRLEMTSSGDLIVMTPSGYDSEKRNTQLAVELEIWNRIQNEGEVVGSSAGFILPNGAIYSPDCAWTQLSRMTTTSVEQQRKYLPLAPDFVAEMRSPSDSLKAMHEKMAEYIANGVSLGWLIDLNSKTVWVYRPNTEPQKLEHPTSISGDPVLAGFVLKMSVIWG